MLAALSRTVGRFGGAKFVQLPPARFNFPSPDPTDEFILI